MELIESINQAVNDFVWGIPMLVVLTLTGIILTLRNLSLIHIYHHLAQAL